MGIQYSNETEDPVHNREVGHMNSLVVGWSIIYSYEYNHCVIKSEVLTNMFEQHLLVTSCQGTGIYAELLHPAYNITKASHYITIMMVFTDSIPKYPHFSNSSCSSSEPTEVCLSESDSCFISLVVSET